MPAFQDLLGQTFGRLTVIELLWGSARTGRRTAYLCRCACGKEKTILACHLVSGHSQSCGCFRLETTETRCLRHGARRTGGTWPEYEVWRSMRARCYKPKTVNYGRYGGRGIVVCERWRNSFENFIADMGRRPSSEHSIDRINNDGNYGPDNCRWATAEEQRNNRPIGKKRKHVGPLTEKGQWFSPRAQWRQQHGLT